MKGRSWTGLLTHRLSLLLCLLCLGGTVVVFDHGHSGTGMAPGTNMYCWARLSGNQGLQ